MSEVVTSVGIAAVGAAFSGSPPGAGGYMLQAGTTNITCSSGGGTMSWPATFPNGVLTVLLSMGDSVVRPDTIVVSASATNKTQLGVGVTVSGSAFSGGVNVFWLAIGW